MGYVLAIVGLVIGAFAFRSATDTANPDHLNALVRVVIGGVTLGYGLLIPALDRKLRRLPNRRLARASNGSRRSRQVAASTPGTPL